LKESDPQVKKINDTMAEVVTVYTEICDFFMIGKNDDMRSKSELFFKFFTSFFDDI